MTAPRSGACLCGASTFTATPAAPHMDACHCTTCRKWAGGPVLAVTVTTLDIPASAPVTWFDSSDHAQRGFCATCGTHLFWRLKDGGFLTVFTGAFDETDDLPLTTEIFTDEQPATYAFAGETTRMTGAEALAALDGES